MPQGLIADIDEARRKTEVKQPNRFERGPLGGLALKAQKYPCSIGTT